MAVYALLSPKRQRDAVLKQISRLLVPSRWWEVSATAEFRDVPVSALDDDHLEKREPTGWIHIAIRVGPKGSAPPSMMHKPPRRKRKSGSK